MDGTTLGVEEELLIVDRATGALVPRSDELVPLARRRLGEHVTGELNRCQIETCTSVHRDLRRLRAELIERRGALDEAAAELDCAVLPVGTHPQGSWEDQQIEDDQPRFKQMEDRYQRVARQQVICGCHVHVGVADRDLAVAAMNRVRPWLPVLLALVANSPYWEGEDTGYDSYRLEIWARWPTAGVPPPLTDGAALDELVDQLRDAGAIEDASHLYWHVRPSTRYPTLELRATDVCLTVDDALLVAGLARALIRACIRELEMGEPPSPASPEVLEAALWRAARYGLGGELVSPGAMEPAPAADVVAELLEKVGRDLDELGDLEDITTRAEAVLVAGNGASRQRAAGPEGAVDLARSLLLPAD